MQQKDDILKVIKNSSTGVSIKDIKTKIHCENVLSVIKQLVDEGFVRVDKPGICQHTRFKATKKAFKA